MTQKLTLTKMQKTSLIIALILSGVFGFLYAVSDILLPFILAFVLAYLLHPAVLTLEKKALVGHHRRYNTVRFVYFECRVDCFSYFAGSNFNVAFQSARHCFRRVGAY